MRDYEAITYQFTPTFFTSHEPSKTTETRIHYTGCLKAFASGKLVYREVCSEGYLRLNNEQIPLQTPVLTNSHKVMPMAKLDMRLDKSDEQAHHCDVQKPEKEYVY